MPTTRESRSVAYGNANAPELSITGRDVPTSRRGKTAREISRLPRARTSCKGRGPGREIYTEIVRGAITDTAINHRRRRRRSPFGANTRDDDILLLHRRPPAYVRVHGANSCVADFTRIRTAFRTTTTCRYNRPRSCRGQADFARRTPRRRRAVARRADDAR